MSSLNSVLDIAKNALLSTQKAISVTSHNIANSNTPGYSRQRANFSTMDSVAYGGLFYGTGVTVEDIQRIYDGFQAVQLRDATSAESMYESKSTVLSALEGILNDLDGNGLGTQLDKFFKGLQDIATDPSSYADRSTLLSTAGALTDKFNTIDSSIRLYLSNMNREIELQVERINSLSEEVASLNNQISSIEVGGASANDLRDKRDQVLREISEMVDIKVLEKETGDVDVYLSGGVFLVNGVDHTDLEVAINDDNPDIFNVVAEDTVVNDSLGAGSIKGTIDGAEFYQEMQDRFDLLAASLVKEINVQHRQGYGLDGTTGNDLFTLNTVYTKSYPGNTGGASVSTASVSDLTQITLDDYEIRFSDASNYSVVDATTGTVASSGSYTSGSAITFDGLSVTITDNTGPPAGGDTFMVSYTEGAAGKVSVKLDDPNSIAASSTAAGVPGDNVNALAMADLKGSDNIRGSTFTEYYSGLVTDLGIASNEASSQLKAHKDMVQQFEIARESLSGVSVEEEAVNLMMLQRAYEASAKVLSTADRMLETLINLV